MWLEVGAGHCSFVPGPTGKMVALPKSIAWDKLDQEEFERVAEGIWAFFHTAHARRFLWPHLSDQQGCDMVEAILGEFE